MLLDDDLLGVAMSPPFVPTAIAMLAEFRARSEMMIAMLDHDGFGACNRRRGDGDSAESRNYITKRLHVVPPHMNDDKTSQHWVRAVECRAGGISRRARHSSASSRSANNPKR